MDVFVPFVSLLFLSTGLGIDNALLIEFSLKGLNLEPQRHLRWRSGALILAALLRIGFLFFLSQLSFLNNPLPAYRWFPNRWFSKHPDELTWMSLVLFVGGLVILAMALWEYYHKLREEMAGATHKPSDSKVGAVRILAVVGYLATMNILFSLDSVFAAVAIMDLKTQFPWMVVAILISSVIMIFGMIPISAIVSKNKHFAVLMLSILAVIATKLLVDGTGAHFSNGLLMFIIGILLLNDVAQAMLDRASRRRELRTTQDP
ncbi:MAG TPA: hypothetical protein DCE43_21020 [Planctomycetaceae bacterium]|jgi:predicted tellurium resistance membrane protein TerC|nr:hypothetical protein [Planctomycetaceae bacterium]HCK52275.1 hypothetical protein [Planctomycetaceae bacterium]|tara:strand:- start:189 stop:971 length:783 start_codon:yes stop_codon:yes gene_type:complete